MMAGLGVTWKENEITQLSYKKVPFCFHIAFPFGTVNAPHRAVLSTEVTETFVVASRQV